MMWETQCHKATIWDSATSTDINGEIWDGLWHWISHIIDICSYLPVTYNLCVSIYIYTHTHPVTSKLHYLWGNHISTREDVKFYPCCSGSNMHMGLGTNQHHNLIPLRSKISANILLNHGV
jgi:hypothetical protein